MKRLLHTPEGVRDIYFKECGKKHMLEKQILDMFHLYGYHSIQTPMFEYFDVFRKEIGTIPSHDLYKFFDKDGNTLVLRPDITPSVARASSTLFKDEELSIRLCYHGNTFINHSKYQGRLREVTQMGVELIGDGSVQADAEMLALAIDALRDIGLKEFQISVGNVAYFDSLIEDVCLDDEAKERVLSLISNRNFYGVEDYLEKIAVDSVSKEAVTALKDMIGGIEIIEKARSYASNEKAIAAIDRLEELYQILKLYGMEQYITFDLSMMGSYGYYTGMIFRAYTYGTGDAVVKGGRYDGLLQKFGKDNPSTGFAIVVDELMNALNRQKIEIPYQKKNQLVVYEKGCFEAAITMAKEFRAKHQNTELLQKEEERSIEEYISFGKKNMASNLIYIKENGDVEHIELFS